MGQHHSRPDMRRVLGILLLLLRGETSLQQGGETVTFVYCLLPRRVLIAMAIM